jgi:site-specific recombinase XerC
MVIDLYLAPLGAGRGHLHRNKRATSSFDRSKKMGRSSKQKLERSLDQASSRAGGSHLTQEARGRTLDRLQDVLQEKGYQNLSSADQLAGRHLKGYVEQRKEDGISPRTLANEMAHIRSVCRPEIANAANLTNKALGIESASREGTKTAVDRQELAAWVDRATELGRDGIAVGYEVSRELGLRKEETIMANADQLRQWSAQLDRGDRVTVWKGTKGGKARDAFVPNKERAQEVLSRAAAIAEAQGGYLVTQKSGEAVRSLKQADSIIKSFNHRNAIEMHRTRYSYARECYQHYREQGYSHRDACALTGVDLGHGDGRGTYVERVYML